MDDTPPTSARPCPICGKPAQHKYRPFCSARCATIDLGRWLDGRYRVPTQDTPEDEPGDEAEPQG